MLRRTEELTSKMLAAKSLNLTLGLFLLIVGGIIIYVFANAVFASIDDVRMPTTNDSDVSRRIPRGTSRNRDKKVVNEDMNESSSFYRRSQTTTPDPDADGSDENIDMEDHDDDDHSSSSTKPDKPKNRFKRRIIFEEQFSHRNWSSYWVHTKDNGNGTKLYNNFSRIYAHKSNHSRPNYGLITNNKGGEFYMIATTFQPFNAGNETLVMQFGVQFQAKAHCQLAFLRLYDCEFTTEEFGFHTPYLVQVGPHICGTTRMSRVSAEFQEPGRTSITSVDKDIEPVNNTSVNMYALVLDSEGFYTIIVNNDYAQNGTLKDEFSNYNRGYTSICGVGVAVWHSVLDKYFKGQLIIDDILIVNDPSYAEKQRKQILKMYSE